MSEQSEQLESLLESQFPGFRKRFSVVEISADAVTVRMRFDDSLLRPGGVIAGPAQMMLVDTVMYLAVLNKLGPVVTFTSSLSIQFLRTAPPADLIAKCTLLKTGRRLATGIIALHSALDDRLVGHATCTYALPSSDVAAG